MVNCSFAPLILPLILPLSLTRECEYLHDVILTYPRVDNKLWVEFCRSKGLDEHPRKLSRDHSSEPIGLKNLGATCYMNALLQTFFHNNAFVRGVFDIPLPTDDNDQPLEVCYNLGSIMFTFIKGD
jgi:ubiquitin C-terminal hydrolase